MKLISDFHALWDEGGWMARTSLVILGLAATVHLLALGGFGVEQAGSALVLVMQCGVILVGWLLVGRGFAQQVRAWRAGVSYRSLTAPSAWRLWLLFAAIGLYMGAWALHLALSWGTGGAEMRDGAYVWMDGARMVRTLTRDEYHRWNAAMLAVFSAAWCWFALGIAIGHRKADVYLREIRARRVVRDSIPA